MDKEINSVPYVVHEGIIARIERQNKRAMIALVIAVVLLFASNALWLYAWTQYDYCGDTMSQDVTLDSKDGIANYIGNNGDINNGKDTRDNVQGNKIP